MAVKKNKKSISELALEEMNQLRTAIQEESRNTVSNLLKEAIKDYIREAEEDEEDDFEVVDDNETENPDTDDTQETGETEVEEPSEESEDNTDENVPTEPEEASVEDEGDDEWSELSKYQVDDNTYDFTGAEDHNDAVKVFKLLNNDDNVIVKKEGDKISLQDNGAGTEYVIDLGCNSEEENCEMNNNNDDFMGEACIKEEIEDDAVAGLPGDELTDEDFDTELTPEDFMSENVKKSRKTMNENVLLEIDLGYTDNYQNEDPIDGLSMTEPSKSGKSWEKGVPTGTEKPWAGETKSKGEPFEKTVNEEDNPMENPVDDVEADQEGVFEGTNVTLPNGRKKSKSHRPDNKDYPKVAHHDSQNGDYKAIAESVVKKAKAIQKENKELKNALEQLKGALREAAMTNVNLGQVTKLIIENTTTKEEKVNILNRFHNEAKTIEQSKALYESISKELNKTSNTVNINENKVANANGSKINESVVYKSQDLLNTIDLMNRMQNL